MTKKNLNHENNHKLHLISRWYKEVIVFLVSILVTSIVCTTFENPKWFLPIQEQSKKEVVLTANYGSYNHRTGSYNIKVLPHNKFVVVPRDKTLNNLENNAVDGQ